MSEPNLFGGGQTGEPPEFATLLESSMENLRFLTANHDIWLTAPLKLLADLQYQRSEHRCV